MISKCTWLDHTKVKSVLGRSFQEFKVSDPITQESMCEKYSLGVDKKKLINLELFEKGNLVASALSSYHEFYADCGPLKLSFLTQVIVQEEYRGRGHLRELMEFAQEVDEKNSSLGSIVIARRKVGSLYTRYGYTGFGVFPQIRIDETYGQMFKLPSHSSDWEKISLAYQNTYRNIPGSIYRSSDYWKHIRNEVSRERFCIKSVESDKNLGYFIFSEEQCSEIAATNPVLFPELLQAAIEYGIKCFKIGANHPIFPLIISLGGKYTIRPEREEGHMLKPYFGGEFLLKEIDEHMTRIQSTEQDEEKYAIDINILNEW